LYNINGALSFNAFAFFANNAGAPTAALGIGADGITHLYCWLSSEPTSAPTRDNSMVGEAGTRTSYYSSGGAPITSHHPPLQRLAMVGCCDLCQTEAAAPPAAANQQQHHLKNVFVSRQLGLMLTYPRFLLDQF
jgi:hypothetical protein